MGSCNSFSCIVVFTLSNQLTFLSSHFAPYFVVQLSLISRPRWNVACGEQTLFSALVSRAEKIAIFSAGETRAEKSESSPDGTLWTVDFLAREQALRGALAAGREKEGRVRNYVSGI